MNDDKLIKDLDLMVEEYSRFLLRKLSKAITPDVVASTSMDMVAATLKEIKEVQRLHDEDPVLTRLRETLVHLRSVRTKPTILFIPTTGE